MFALTEPTILPSTVAFRNTWLANSALSSFNVSVNGGISKSLYSFASLRYAALCNCSIASASLASAVSISKMFAP